MNNVADVALNWRASAWTDAGPKRGGINEDSLLERTDMLLWAVADGMGGHEAGQIASSNVVKHLDGCPLPDRMGQSCHMLRNALTRCNEELRSFAKDNNWQVVGSTVVLMVARLNYCTLMWAGDSRIYRVRNQNIEQLTMDHSHVAELVSQGHISEAEAELHPQANAITRAVGAHNRLVVDSLTLEVLPGDQFVLCSDGLTAVLNQSDIRNVLREWPDGAGKALVELAIERRTPDNVTAVVVSA